MKFVQLALLSLIFLVSCDKDFPASTDTELTLSFNKSYNVYGNAGKRIFLIHGLNGSRENFDTPGVFKNLKDGLVSQGNQVITFDIPKTKYYYFDALGLNYRQKYKEFLDWLVADTNEKLGNAPELIIGGISFGGLHTLMGVATTSYFNRYFAILPVIYIQALSELSMVNAPQFNPLYEVPNIQKIHGVIHWGTLDERVNFRYSVQLVQKLGASVDGIEHIGLGHTTTEETVQEVIRWVCSRTFPKKQNY